MERESHPWKISVGIIERSRNGENVVEIDGMIIVFL